MRSPKTKRREALAKLRANALRPIGSSLFSRPRLALFIAAFTPSFLLYLLTLARTVTTEDSGELITAAYTLGVAHPPGYPLWCLLGKAFTWIPVGSIAFRIHLLSAFFGALSAGMLALIAERLTRDRVAALVSALLFAATRDLWGQSVIAEVYTLNVFLILLFVYLLLEFDATSRTRWLYVGGLVAGLGVTNHTTMVPLVPIFSLWAFLRAPALLKRPVLLVNLALSFALGVSILLYIPIRSAADPVIDWGDPEGIAGAWSHFLREQYEGTAPEPNRSIASQATLVLRFLEGYGAQFTLPVALLSIPGAILAFLRARWQAALLFVLFGMTSYGFMFLLGYEPTRESLHLVRVFFLPAYAVGAVWIAFSLSAISTRLRSLEPLPRLSRLGVIAPALLVLLPISAHYSANDRSEDYLADDWGRNLLRSLERDAIILPTADHSTFPLLYLQTVEGLRPDVLIGNKYGAIEDRFFDEVFPGGSAPRRPPPLGGTNREKEAFLVEESGRPVFFTARTDSGGASFSLVSWGLIFKAVRSKAEGPTSEMIRSIWERTEFRSGSLERAPGDFGADLVLSDYHYARGRRALEEEDLEGAVRALAEAARYGEGIASILNNLGSALAEAGHGETALPFLLRSARTDPSYSFAARNLASVYSALGRYAEGLPWFQRSLEESPNQPSIELAKARGYRDRKSHDLARLAYEVLISKDPGSDALWKEYESFATPIYGQETVEAFRETVRRRASERERRDELVERAATEPTAVDPMTSLPPELRPRVPTPSGGAPLVPSQGGSRAHPYGPPIGASLPR